MRNLLGSGSSHLADTPPNGDFARYVEDLVAKQSRTLAGGQQMTPVPRKPQSTTTATKPMSTPTPTRAQTRAAELSRQTPPTVPNTRAATRAVVLDSWEELKPTPDQKGTPPMPGSALKIPPLLIFMAVIMLYGATSFFGIKKTWPVFILFMVVVGARMGRILLGIYRSNRLGKPPQRK